MTSKSSESVTSVSISELGRGLNEAELPLLTKLEDAYFAGTEKSMDCTLILTEGDSAKSLVMAGLSVIGREKYGVFPIKGKPLNVRDLNPSQSAQNAELKVLMKILGLNYCKQYNTEEDKQSLRYGVLLLMTDQDKDGSHIKGLLINFIHANWPGLIKLSFLQQFITPIMKAKKGKDEHYFYNFPEFDDWKTREEHFLKYKIKYYKGLGTSTAEEAKQYFSEMQEHCIKFKYNGPEDDKAIILAFGKNMADQRKNWLLKQMQGKTPDVGVLYRKGTNCISYSDFIHKELILFSFENNHRTIPSVVDGLKPGQRKIIFTCLEKNYKRDIKVMQLAGAVVENAAYQHGESSLSASIINLGQNFVGSNNMNLLLPVGQFGTRLEGGKDAAHPRYIYTKLSPITTLLFSKLDSPLLNYLYEENVKVEPQYYVPIIPMVLVNGAEGIGTGWSTRVPCYNPKDIIKNIYRLLDQQEPEEMIPWFKNFKGTIEKAEDKHFLVKGIMKIENGSIEISELPVKTWTKPYKDNVLNSLLQGSETSPPLISKYTEEYSDTSIKFLLTMAPNKSETAKISYETLKLQSTISLTNMMLFDHLGRLKQYNSPIEILKEFFEVRYSLYQRRQKYMVNTLQDEVMKLQNQGRFISEKIAGKINIENCTTEQGIKILESYGYQPDPQKLTERSADEKKKTGNVKEDFNYLFQMNFSCLMNEAKSELMEKCKEKMQELENLSRKTPEELWKEDLKKLTDELDAYEKKEECVLKEKETKKRKEDEMAEGDYKKRKSEDHN